MARPEKNTVEYFPHLLSDGKKMFFIEKKYGNNGYATWFKILEKLASTEYHYLNLGKDEEVMFLSAKCNISEETLLAIIEDLVKLTSFNAELWKNKILWSDPFIESIQDAYEKRKNNCITIDGLRVHLTELGILKLSKSESKDPVKPQTILKEIKLKKTTFHDSPFFDKVKFKESMPSDWTKEKLVYYYEAAIRYSDEGNKYAKWSAAVRSWAKNDELQGKIKFTNPADNSTIVKPNYAKRN